MNQETIKNIVGKAIPLSVNAGFIAKKATVKDTYTIGSLTGNRLNSGTLRSQFVFYEKEIDWTNTSDQVKKALHSDQRVFVQVGDDIWDVYKGESLSKEDQDPVRIKHNVNDLSDLIQTEREALAFLQIDSNDDSEQGESARKPTNLQVIFFGPPGSGKSHTVEDIVKDRYPDKSKREEYVFRTIFHPDSDYASFVGSYKPCMSRLEKTYSLEELVEIFKKMKASPEPSYRWHKFGAKYWESLKKLEPGNLKYILEEAGDDTSMHVEIKKGMMVGEAYLRDKGKILYRFVPQTFTNAYVKAWSEQSKNVFLIIEEINRGNCAQIFGDLFQLLDRENGVSRYPINADTDLRQFLEDELGKDNEGILGGKLRLPQNLYIWATMNTSDQSLFPMDSAFKRRWDWECVPIDYNHPDSKSYSISIDSKTYNWNKFIEKVNEKISDTTKSEDKQIGNFFIKGNITQSEFVSKVMFYLWNDVCKEEYGTQYNFFRDENDNEFSFSDLFGNNASQKLIGFMKHLGVKPIDEDNSESNANNAAE